MEQIKKDRVRGSLSFLLDIMRGWVFYYMPLHEQFNTTLDQVPKDRLKHNLLHLKYADYISTTVKRYVLMGTNTTLYTQAVRINVRTKQPLQLLTLLTILHNNLILIRGTGIFMACTSMKYSAM